MKQIVAKRIWLGRRDDLIFFLIDWLVTGNMYFHLLNLLQTSNQNKWWFNHTIQCFERLLLSFSKNLQHQFHKELRRVSLYKLVLLPVIISDCWVCYNVHWANRPIFKHGSGAFMTNFFIWRCFLCVLLVTEGKKKLEKSCNFVLKASSHVRTLIHWTWPTLKNIVLTCTPFPHLRFHL